jgi:hypothetical protein
MSYVPRLRARCTPRCTPRKGSQLPVIKTREIERRAADLVVAELGALRWEPRDIRDGTQMRDFDVVFDDHEEPLEVTTSADANVAATMNRMNGNNHIRADVRRTWMVTAPYTSTGAAGKKTPFDRQRAVDLLVPLIEQHDRDGKEELDFTKLAYAFGNPDQPAALELFEHLGIRGCRSYDSSTLNDEPAIWLHVGGGGWCGADSVTSALEKAAADDGNQAKLDACSEAPRRHLFVALTPASEELEHPALLDVLDGRNEPMPTIPRLPSAITTVWAGPMERAGTIDRGIYVTPPSDWQIFGSAKAR